MALVSRSNSLLKWIYSMKVIMRIAMFKAYVLTNVSRLGRF